MRFHLRCWEKNREIQRDEQWQHFAAASVNRMDLMGRNVDYPGRTLIPISPRSESRSPYSDYYVKYHTALSGKLSQFALHLRRRRTDYTAAAPWRYQTSTTLFTSLYFQFRCIRLEIISSAVCSWASCDLSSLFFSFSGPHRRSEIEKKDERPSHFGSRKLSFAFMVCMGEK